MIALAPLERWARVAESPSPWRSRLRAMAALVAPGESVLDVGAGSRELYGMLPPGCRYLPLDILPSSAETQVHDLNSNEPIPVSADVAIVSGVLEYVTDPARAIAKICAAAPRVILSYNHPEHGSGRGADWLSDMSESALRVVLLDLGCNVSLIQSDFGECIYEARR